MLQVDSVSLSPNNVGGDRETGRPSDGFGVGQEPRSACGDVGAPEEWRPVTVEGYADRYEVSSLGRIRRTKAARGTRLGKVLAASSGANGYPGVRLSNLGGCGVITRYVHDLVARAFLGPPPVGHEVDHRDHVRTNNRLSNLRWLPESINRGIDGKRCGNCGKPGHTQCGHRGARGPYACGICGSKDGHNRQSCDQGRGPSADSETARGRLRTRRYRARKRSEAAALQGVRR